MSVIFGKWNFDGRTPSPEHLDQVHASLSPYGPDGFRSYSTEGLSIGYHAFYTTKDSRQEPQPFVTRSGLVIAWDGRLDNRQELIAQSQDALPDDSADVCIAAAAYQRWGAKAFGKIIGDWALSIWNPKNHSLILAKDLVGQRQLFYSRDEHSLTWSTVLDPLVLYAENNFAVDQEYIAGWLSFFPRSDLTPYVGIRSVPSSCFVHFQKTKETTKKYWDFDPAKQIRYKAEAEYEDHFRTVFAEAVRRRLRSDGPILAELSGGMDSSSIVCMADEEIARGAAETIRLDTVSYFDNSESAWNEFPYFSKVEERRGRVGRHIDVRLQHAFPFTARSNHFAATPASGGGSNGASRQFAEYVKSHGYRVVLSGIGGDEVTGGVSTPTPELEDLFITAQFRTLARQLKIWALNKRQPWFYLLFEAVRGFLPSEIAGTPESYRPALWLNRPFARKHRHALSGYRPRLKVFGPLPSFQENLFALEVLRRQLACTTLATDPPFEKRYPYLDRDLLEFLYAIPREQLVRPGQRRSLMRRALAGIVPTEILDRKSKAVVARGPTVTISAHWADLVCLTQEMATSSLGIVAAKDFADVLEHARRGRAVPIIPLFRTLAIETWLRDVEHRLQTPVHEPASMDLEPRRVGTESAFTSK